MTNKALTLVEVCIVMAIIAVISAVAIPNILDSRRFSQEMSAASNLRSKVYPALIQFAASGEIDIDKDGRGEFPAHISILAGAFDPSASDTQVNGLPKVGRNLIGDSSFNNWGGSSNSNSKCYSNGGTDYTDRSALVDGYEYGIWTSTNGAVPDVNDAERFCVVIAAPAHGTMMQSAFAICMNDGFYPRVITTKATVDREKIDMKELCQFNTPKGIYNQIDFGYGPEINGTMRVNEAVAVQMTK